MYRVNLPIWPCDVWNGEYEWQSSKGSQGGVLFHLPTLPIRTAPLFCTCFTDAAFVSAMQQQGYERKRRLAPSFLMKCRVSFRVCCLEYDLLILLISAVCGSKWHGMRKATCRPCGRKRGGSKCQTETHHWQLSEAALMEQRCASMWVSETPICSNLHTMLRKNGKHMNPIESPRITLEHKA